MNETIDTGDLLESLDQIERDLLVSQQNIQSIGDTLELLGESTSQTDSARSHDVVNRAVNADAAGLQQAEVLSRDRQARRSGQPGPQGPADRGCDVQAEGFNDPLASLRRVLARSANDRGTA